MAAAHPALDRAVAVVSLVFRIWLALAEVGQGLVSQDIELGMGNTNNHVYPGDGRYFW
jgi:hypothetical protein